MSASLSSMALARCSAWAASRPLRALLHFHDRLSRRNFALFDALFEFFVAVFEDFNFFFLIVDLFFEDFQFFIQGSQLDLQGIPFRHAPAGKSSPHVADDGGVQGGGTPRDGRVQHAARGKVRGGGLLPRAGAAWL